MAYSRKHASAVTGDSLWIGRSSAMRDSAEISGTSMNRSTVERWKSVARSGAGPGVMVVFGGCTTGRLESFPLMMIRCEVAEVISRRLSCHRHTEACSGGDGIGDRLRNTGGFCP